MFKFSFYVSLSVSLVFLIISSRECPRARLYTTCSVSKELGVVVVAHQEELTQVHDDEVADLVDVTSPDCGH